MPASIDRQHFERFCRIHSGQSFTTLYSPSRFKMVVQAGPAFQITFISEKNGKRWTVTPRVNDLYLREYARNGGSLRPKDYKLPGAYSVSRMVSLFRSYLDHLPGCKCYSRQ